MKNVDELTISVLCSYTKLKEFAFFYLYKKILATLSGHIKKIYNWDESPIRSCGEQRPFKDLTDLTIWLAVTEVLLG